MRKLLLCFLLFGVPAFAQERPIAASTVQTTDTTANSLLVGCAVGSTTCTGGIKAGPATFTGSASGTFGLSVQNTSANAAAFGSFSVQSDTGQLFIQTSSAASALGAPFAAGNGSAIRQLSAGGLSISAEDAAGTIRFYTGGTTQRWGYNAAGDHTFGTSAHIADSSGTPTCNTGGCTGTGSSVSGTDYAMVVVTTSSSSTTSFALNLGHTFTSAPVCSVSSGNTNQNPYIGNVTTTSLLVGYDSSASKTFYILCRGY